MIKASIVFTLTAALMLAVFVFGLSGKTASALWTGSAFIIILNILSFAYINGAFDQRPAIVIRRYMGSMTVKLLVSVGLLVAYMMQPDRSKPIAVFLVVMYFVLLMLNGAMAMRNMRGKWGDTE